MTVDSKQRLQPILRDQSPGTLLLIGGAEVSDASLKICLSHANQYVAVDSGADTLRNAGITPHAVIGDLDSISSDARHGFASILHETPDQNLTDFEKALIAVSGQLILAPGFLGGRLDHTIATLNVLVRHADRPVILLNETELVFATRGTCVLPVGAGLPCAVLPAGPSRVTTHGLRWDLNDQVLAPDGLVSSSNKTAAQVITVDAKEPVIVTLPVSTLEIVQDVVRER